MKSRLFVLFLMTIAIVVLFTNTASVQAQQACTTIQSGLLTGSGGVIDVGFNQWGYNYQAMAFNGKYCDAYQNALWCQPYVNDDLQMKWNEAWLSNQDCDGDGKLDRHFGFTSYIGSGAWLTNHQKGTYLDLKGKKQRWEYFTKIVAVPQSASQSGGIWYVYDVQAQAQVAIGPVLWGEFAVVLEVYNDTGTGDHGILYKSPLTSGFGFYGPKP